jgi:hypothetical protein
VLRLLDQQLYALEKKNVGWSYIGSVQKDGKKKNCRPFEGDDMEEEKLDRGSKRRYIILFV